MKITQYLGVSGCEESLLEQLSSERVDKGHRPHHIHSPSARMVEPCAQRVNRAVDELASINQVS